jgi:hypothetical protein
MDCEQLIDLTEPEALVTFGGNRFQCWTGGAVAIAGAVTMDPIVLATGLWFLANLCP